MPRVYSLWDNPSVGEGRRLDILTVKHDEEKVVYIRVHFPGPDGQIFLTKYVLQITESNQRVVTKNAQPFKRANGSSGWEWLELCDPAWLEWLVEKIGQLSVIGGKLRLYKNKLTAQVLICLTDTPKAPELLKPADLWKKCYGTSSGRHDTSGSDILTLTEETGRRLGIEMRCRFCGHLIRTS